MLNNSEIFLFLLLLFFFLSLFPFFFFFLFFMLATSLLLSSRCCGDFALHFPEITSQSKSVAGAARSFLRLRLPFLFFPNAI